METIQKTDIEQVQEEAGTPEVDVTVEKGPDIEGASQLHAEAEDMADEFDVNGFKCVHEKCGLVHTHDTTKHRASDSFDMSDDQAADMEANPNCHCGLNELARRGIADKSPDQANRTAPIPDEMARHLDSTF